MRWDGPCGHLSEGQNCRFDVPGLWVQYWDDNFSAVAIPATIAVFEEIDTDDDGVPDSSDAFPEDPAETADADGDGVGDNGDAFPDDATESSDSDEDGVGDNADAFPNDASESVDSDGDGVGDNGDAFPEDSSETADSDGDGTGDNADAFPNDSTETIDSDGDGVGDNSDAFPNDAGETGDSDGDGVGDASDAFPDDPAESADADMDGVGDNADAFPNDANESLDSDGDGVGDNGDAFPLDATEATDSDGDGTGDNSDAFPEDETESSDSDGDGVGDNADALPNDATETQDSDGDGVGDNADAFPMDETETADSDGDGVGDNADPTPNGDGDSSAMACFNAELGSPGTMVSMSYHSESPDGEVPFSYDEIIIGGETYNGMTVNRASTDTVTTGIAASTSHTDRYFVLGSDPGSVIVYGLTVEVAAQGVMTNQATEFVPFLQESFDLEEGESHTFNWTNENTTIVLGFELTTSQAITRTTTYIGRESVTVPAGTFDTCRMEETGTLDGVGSEATTNWWAVGSGVLVKSTSDGTVTELLSGVVNGTAL